ncbi:ferrous iron transport protein A [Reichenbachiella agarivorans]|uniref:Ferrous iron transport protein A n=1 Tax=Reichenbachiella agarivorans TaxID=2979464 RepID=A0ABY6CT92_9BACT|nr:FeoA family protein [Reichenbachiella agarivorans]UXP33741.1 ferrous iron transport protein A [Reichenbachiella agarivorans]
MIKSAADLKPGQRGMVKDFTDEYISLKLLEMGVLPGTEIEMKFAAPLGDPICVDVSGYALSLRLEEARTIILS